MPRISRRHFTGLSVALTGRALPGIAASSGAPLVGTLKSHAVPAASAMAAGPEKILFQESYGHRDSKRSPAITTQSIFRIASMTKPVTAVATMQLVERGKVKLDEPVATYLPKLAELQVIEGFAADGHPKLRPAAGPVLVRHLLTHTSGFSYAIWDAEQKRYDDYRKRSKAPEQELEALSFDPGTQWHYGTSMDWAGRLVEAVSGQTLEAYFQQEILQPLGMKDTSFILPEDKFDRLVNGYKRDDHGALVEQPRKMPNPPKSFNGGGGLYSTPEDYVKFMQMFLRRGEGGAGGRILRGETVDLMGTNHVGSLSAGKLKSVDTAYSADMDVHPGHTDGFGYGFLINSEDYDHGRAAGSLGWAGINNTFFWIDPHRQKCAVIMMQFLPFCDPAAMAVLRDFERTVYASAKGHA